MTWAVYRDVNSLDPAYAFDYPENTAISLMCESLLRQQPDGSLTPGLATVTYPSPTSIVFTIRQGAAFWDGHPVTPADVVYSLGRQTSPAVGGFYGQAFDPREVHRGDRRRPGDDHAQAARLLAAR